MKNLETQDIRQGVYSCAAYGAIAWTAYAIVECWFSVILPWLIAPGHDYTPLDRGFTLLLFFIYPMTGLILGGLIGYGLSATAGRKPILQKAEPSIFFSTMGTFTVVLALSINFAAILRSDVHNLHLLPPIFISVLLILALTLSALSVVWSKRFFFLANPYTACILLIGLPWMTSELLANHSRTTKVFGILVYSVVILFIAAFIARMFEKQKHKKTSEPVQTSAPKSILFLSIVAFIFFFVSFFCDQTPFSEDSNSKKSPSNLPQTNVIMIIMDTVRADHLSLYGYQRNTTPNLIKFAKEAILYTNGIASGNTTLTTHASIFTGIYASHHGAHSTPNAFWGLPLSHKFQTLAETLSEKGYFTMGIVSNYGYLSHNFNLVQGFRYFDNRVPVHFYSPTKPYYLRQRIRNIFTRFASPWDFEVKYRRAKDINTTVYDMLDRAHFGQTPFFLFINYMDSHLPYIPPPPFDTLYPGKDETYTTRRYSEENAKLTNPDLRLSQKDRNHIVSQYDGGIAYMDFHIGKLMTRLKERRLYDNSMIIITADHGEAFGKRNLLGHGSSVYQDQIYVPLIIKYPGTNKGGVIDKLTNSVDLMPTILDVLGFDKPDGLQGESLIKLKPGNPRIVISESFYFNRPLDSQRRSNPTERAIFSGTLKFIQSAGDKREVYDISKDPNEQKNLYKADNHTYTALEAKLNHWLKTTETKGSFSPGKLDKNAIDRLKTLGYVQ